LFGLVLLYAIGVENTVGLIVICAGLLFLFLPANYFFYGSIGLLTPILLLAIYGYESQELFNTGITTPDSNQLGASIILTLVFISSTHTLGEKKRYRFFILPLLIFAGLVAIMLTDPFLRNGFINNYL
jgi:hypothetical protein